MKTVGQILREAREKQYLNLEQAEKATKIRKKILEKLEKSDWKNLPSPTFVKGLLRNYGEYLDLDVKKLLAFFRREYDEPKVQKVQVSTKLNNKRFRFTPQIISTTVLILIFFFAGAYLFSQYQSFSAAPLLEVSEPSDNIKNETLDVNVIGKTYPDATLKINGQKIQLSPGGTFSVAVSLVEGINTIVVTAENRFGKISTEKRTVVVESKEAGVVNKRKEEEISLTLNIGPQSANVRVEIDGQKTFEGVLLPGSEKQFSAEGRIKLFTSNAGSTKVTFKDDEQILGKEGESLEKEFK